MENCTIYSHNLAFDKVVEIVQTNLPKAQVEYADGGMQKSLTASMKGGLFGKSKTLKICTDSPKHQKAWDDATTNT